MAAPPFYTRMRSFDTNLDRYFIYEFLLPATLLMHSGGYPTGTTDQDGPQTVHLHSCQTLTPETEHSTHYFFQQALPGPQRDQSLVDSIYGSLEQAFNEDRDMITAQHRNLGRVGARPMLPLAMDAALLQFRRVLESRLALE